MLTWIERARWEWTGPHYGHEVWIQAYVDDQTHEIASWCVATRLGGAGKAPKKRYFRVGEFGPRGACERAYEAARAYREEFGGPIVSEGRRDR